MISVNSWLLFFSLNTPTGTSCSQTRKHSLTSTYIYLIVVNSLVHTIPMLDEFWEVQCPVTDQLKVPYLSQPCSLLCCLLFLSRSHWAVLPTVAQQGWRWLPHQHSQSLQHLQTWKPLIGLENWHKSTLELQWNTNLQNLQCIYIASYLRSKHLFDVSLFSFLYSLS